VTVNVAEGVGVRVIVGVNVWVKVCVGLRVNVKEGIGEKEGMGPVVSSGSGGRVLVLILSRRYSSLIGEHAKRKSKPITALISKLLIREVVISNLKYLITEAIITAFANLTSHCLLCIIGSNPIPKSPEGVSRATSDRKRGHWLRASAERPDRSRLALWPKKSRLGRVDRHG